MGLTIRQERYAKAIGTGEAATQAAAERIAGLAPKYGTHIKKKKEVARAIERYRDKEADKATIALKKAGQLLDRIDPSSVDDSLAAVAIAEKLTVVSKNIREQIGETDDTAARAARGEAELARYRRETTLKVLRQARRYGIRWVERYLARLDPAWTAVDQQQDSVDIIHHDPPADAKRLT